MRFKRDDIEGTAQVQESISYYVESILMSGDEVDAEAQRPKRLGC